MFVLMLNDMRFPNIELTEPVARANTPEELHKYINNQKVDNYRDERWSKSFAKDGPLEWFNQPYDLDNQIREVGTEDDWAEEAREKYRNDILCIPLI